MEEVQHIFLSLQIEYEIDEIQLSYLQLLSNHAQQVFTFKCKNAVAWYDQSARSFKKAVKFEGSSGHEFSSKSKSKKAMIKVPFDGCQVTVITSNDMIFWTFTLPQLSNSYFCLWIALSHGAVCSSVFLK